MTATRLASVYGVSPRTARRLLRSLVANGYAETTGSEHGRPPDARTRSTGSIWTAWPRPSP
ncbi:helix-turn-helix domain-containing protein [Actinomadura madurae]|uniref:helix-turn-helix domain-containing protein n=1 Tax=Actinomadura madurae TaxID=1993 RepID=UPI0020D237C9|nr:helix-turn-helix domain-containing protein [Actinomadura madurae]MCQ0016343.1 hypothetical protein [Actinomadura madurae]